MIKQFEKAIKNERKLKERLLEVGIELGKVESRLDALCDVEQTNIKLAEFLDNCILAYLQQATILHAEADELINKVEAYGPVPDSFKEVAKKLGATINELS